jgi:pyridoxal phosphate enzyme (YggS family)
MEGARLVGENYVQEAILKMEILKDLPIEWHLIGPLQKNKAKRALEAFSMIQTLDSIKLAERLDTLAKDKGLKVSCLVEVNVAKEPTKAGVFPENLMGFLEELSHFLSLEVLGLMAMPPLSADPQALRADFDRVYGLFREAKDKGYRMLWLSMGTSHDFELAIQSGANMVRIGSYVFGSRPPKEPFWNSSQRAKDHD